jgi:uncharacterized YigZ family protein
VITYSPTGGEMLILKSPAQTELVVKKSRFIAIAQICTDITQVKEMVEKVRRDNPGANHVVHAAVVGNQFSFSDDREPKNTAGRPAFEVLKGSGISNICVMVVRYFGGTLLGTGGLVKAYGDSVKNVLQVAETEEYVEKSRFEFSIPYPMYENVKRLLASLDAVIENEDFQSAIVIKGLVPVANQSSLQDGLSELSNGSIKASLTNV